MQEVGADSEGEETGKVPAAAFVGSPLFSRISLSPNGRRVAVLVTRKEVDLILSVDLATGEKTPLAYLERKDAKFALSSQRIEDMGWASDDIVVMSSSRPAPGLGIRPRRTTLLASDIRNPEVRDLGKDWPYSGYLQFQNRIISYLPDDPKRVLLNWFGMARGVDIRFSRLRESKAKIKGIGGWGVDHEFKLRVGFSKNRWENDFAIYARVSEEDRMERMIKWDPLDKDAIGEGFFFEGFSERPGTIYISSDRQTGRLAIYEYDIPTRTIGRLVWEHPKYDADGILTSSVDGRLLAISHVEDRPVMEFVDARFRKIWEPIENAFPGKTISIVDLDRWERTSIFAVSSDDTPPIYYRLVHATGEYSRLFRSRPALDGLTLAKTTAVTFEARDGLEIHGYLTKPPGADAPTATVVLVHGGPFARDDQGWDGSVQFLVSRGFNVFQINFRGSSGYGRAFREAGYQQYGLAMQDDLTDGTRWLIREGIADPARIGIFGVGYGGYVALHGLTSTPELYAAGASYGGISDLPTLLADDDRGYVQDVTTRNEVLIGSRWSDRVYLESISPARHADQIRAPVLLGHGTHDWDVHIRHTDLMTSALEDAGIEHEVYRYRGESHETIDERTRIDFYQKLGAFFERHLKPDPALVLPPLPTPPN